MEMTEFYRVRKEFKYNGKIYKVGEEWKPADGLYDKELIEQGRFVTLTKDRKAERATKVKRAEKGLFKASPLSEDLLNLLAENGLDTPEKIQEAEDYTILAIPGIGKATLKKIRDNT
jgi:hypothetical protein